MWAWLFVSNMYMFRIKCLFNFPNYPPWKRGDIGLSLSVCPSVRPSVCLSVCPSVPLDIGYFVHASLVWRSWARAFKFCTRMNQGLKSCLVKVLSRSVENCRFWSTLKIVDFKLFFQIPSTLCRRVWSEAIGLDLSNFIHALTKVWSRASSKFYLDRLKIVDSGAL